MTKKTKHRNTKSADGTLRLNLSQPGSFSDMGFDFGGSRGRPSKPYSQVEWVWICVNLIIDICKSIQLVLCNTNEEIIESGPAWEFLFNNPKKPFREFISETIGFYTLYREVYWIFTDKELQSPKSIIVAGPNTCKPEIRQGVVVGYTLYTEGGRVTPLFLEDVWRIKNFNPDRTYEGVGPLKAGEIDISSSHQATEYNEATMANGARLGTILVAPAGVKLDESERRALISQFESVHRGARNAGKTMLATGGLEPKPFGQTMVELQMIDLRKYDAATICAMFGIPMEMVNMNPEAQYAHGPATQRVLIYTISPALSDIAQNITDGILNLFRFKSHSGVAINKSLTYCGSKFLHKRASFRIAKIKAIQSRQKIYAYFDVENHPAIQEMERDKIEKVLKYAANGIPINQIIDAYDLPFDTTQIPWGNDHFISPALVPARWIIEGGPEGYMGTGPSLPEGQPTGEPPPEPAKSKTIEAEEKSDETRKLRIWKNWVVSWAGLEREYTGALRSLFVRQQRELLEKLNAAMQSAKSMAEKGAADDEVITRVVFDLKKENGKIRAINHTFFDKGSELGIRQAASEAGIVGAELVNQFVETAKRSAAIRRALIIQSQKIEGVNAATQRMIANQLRDGLKAGEGLSDLTKRVSDVLGSNRARAQSIARTQTGGAVSSGRHEGMKQAGIELHIWLDSHDDHVRDLHKDAGKRYARGIPIDEPFAVGGDFLMHPGDPAGSPANVINCRCVELTGKSNENKTLVFERYANFKFVSYEDMQTKTV